MGPGSILRQRPLPRRPTFRKGIIALLLKILGGNRNTIDLYEKLSQVILALRDGDLDQARSRSRQVLSDLSEIERNGSKFVLDSSDWHAISQIGHRAVQAARQNNASFEVTEMLSLIHRKLESFSLAVLNGKR